MKLSPRGLLATAAVILVAGVCVRLGVWQLSRLDERRARNEAVRAAAFLPPRPLDAAAFRAAEDTSALRWRRVVVTGRYRPAGEQVLRGRARGGRPGIHLATPLETAAGTVMVLRGWAPSADGATVDRATLVPPEGEVRVEGVLLPLPGRPDRGLPIPAATGDTTWRRLDVSTARARGTGPVLPLYLQRLPGDGDTAALPLAVPLPELSEGSHLGYAIQWFSFAAIALIGLAVVVLRPPRR